MQLKENVNLAVVYKSYYDFAPNIKKKKSSQNTEVFKKKLDTTPVKKTNINYNNYQKKITSNGSTYLNTPMKEEKDSFFNNFGSSEIVCI